MPIYVEIVCQVPDDIKIKNVVAEFPYGEVAVKAVMGGLDISHPLRPDNPSAIIAHAAIIVSIYVIRKDK